MKKFFCCVNSADEELETQKVLEKLKLQEPKRIKESSVKAEVEDGTVLRIFPVGSSGYIGKVEVTRNTLNLHSESAKCSTVVLLDRSGSMSKWVQHLTRKILPQVFADLGYKNKDEITILAFDNCCEICVCTVEGLKDCKLFSRGGTVMKPAVDALKIYLENIKTEGVRILSISDGEIFDKEQTKKTADSLAAEIKNELRINSQAVQIFSSAYANPDTMALCSLLQLNNTKSSQVANIFNESSLEEQVAQVVNLIADDGLEFDLKLTTKGNIFKKELWETEFFNEIHLKKGENTFWINSNMVDELCNGTLPVTLGKNTAIPVILESKQDGVEEVSGLLAVHFKHVYEYLKILRIINSDTSQELMSNIVKQYSDLEAQLAIKCGEEETLDILAQKGMASRMVYLRQELLKRSAGFSMKLAQIANDNTINALNSAQKAEYLRSTSHSKTSRGLAKRAAISGFNFDEIAREEALKIANHLDELVGVVDDSRHQCSFYSMETTLGGIKAVADLTREANFDECTANDILLLLNIVGVACEGPMGDFPDPMTWRVNRIYPGVFVSVSDIMTSKIQCRDSESFLSVPGHEDSKITNAIPVFEDKRIAKFLRKHAPHLLSYTCSIGMRGMLAHVVMTDGYTLCAGIWKLVEHVANSPTELTLNTFDHMVKSYDMFSGQYFNNSRGCLLADGSQDPSLSFYLQNNGLTNMIAPIYHQCASGSFSKMEPNIPAILRALYSYESWQVYRHEFKGADSNKNINEMLNNLLGIDLDKHAIKLPELLEQEPNYNDLKFYDQAHFNYEHLDQFINTKGWYLKYVLIIVILLKHVADGTLDQIKGPITLSECLKDEQFIKTQLGLPAEYELKDYLMYTAVQSLMYPKMNDRVDQDNDKMFINDLIYPNKIKEMIREHVVNQYKYRYDFDRVNRLKLENSELFKMFLEALSKCSDRRELIRLFKEGVSKGEKTFIYKGFRSLGFIGLKQRILDTSSPMILRKDVLEIFLLACDLDNGCEPLFNEGKSAAIQNIEQFQEVFMENCGGSAEEWDVIFAEYKIRCIHAYRSSNPNRHGHHNDKPSYWALGFVTLADFAKNHTPDEFVEYCKVHHDCCGVNFLKN